MKYEDLDTDTQGVINTMVHITGKTKEHAILALVEFGMLSMIAAIKTDRQSVIVQKIFDIVNSDEKLKETASAYSGQWCV